MSEHRHIHLPRRHQEESQSNNRVIISLLLLLLIASVFVYTALRVGNDGGQTTTDGQCLSNGTQFNGRLEALTLAQMSEDHRTGHPFNGNYGYCINYRQALD